MKIIVTQKSAVFEKNLDQFSLVFVRKQRGVFSTLYRFFTLFDLLFTLGDKANSSVPNGMDKRAVLSHKALKEQVFK